MTFGDEKMRIDQTKANYWRLKVKFSQICSMKSIGSGWENLNIQLALKGLRVLFLIFGTEKLVLIVFTFGIKKL